MNERITPGNAESQLRPNANASTAAELGLRIPGKAFWMPDYWDRYIRNEKHNYSVIEYIHHNPIKAGLCISLNQWLWSSIHFIKPETVERDFSHDSRIPNQRLPK